MRYEILDAPNFGMLELTLEPGEKAVAESGAMVAMGPSISVDTRLRGGLLAAAKRKLLGGESLFQNTFMSQGSGQKLYLAPPVEGDLVARELVRGETFFLQSGNYLAHVGDELVLDTSWGGVRSFFGGLGFFMLQVTGPGTLFYGSYGAIHEVPVGAGGYTCDTGHIVGFTSGLEYRVRPFGGFKGLFFSGEGLICDFDGRGSVFLQTRSAPSLAAFLHPYRRVERSGND
jgi:uncharacterized protein (TIGR00266 family)